MTKSNEQVRAELAMQKGRLDYAVLQLAREAKFLPKHKPENARFHRAFETVSSVRDGLDILLGELP
jgi:hypothetical protein